MQEMDFRAEVRNIVLPFLTKLDEQFILLCKQFKINFSNKPTAQSLPSQNQRYQFQMTTLELQSLYMENTLPSAETISDMRTLNAIKNYLSALSNTPKTQSNWATQFVQYIEVLGKLTGLCLQLSLVNMNGILTDLWGSLSEGIQQSSFIHDDDKHYFILVGEVIHNANLQHQYLLSDRNGNDQASKEAYMKFLFEFLEKKKYSAYTALEQKNYFLCDVLHQLILMTYMTEFSAIQLNLKIVISTFIYNARTTKSFIKSTNNQIYIQIIEEFRIFLSETLAAHHPSPPTSRATCTIKTTLDALNKVISFFHKPAQLNPNDQIKQLLTLILEMKDEDKTDPLLKTLFSQLIKYLIQLIPKNADAPQSLYSSSGKTATPEAINCATPSTYLSNSPRHPA